MFDPEGSCGLRNFLPIITPIQNNADKKCQPFEVKLEKVLEDPLLVPGGGTPLFKCMQLFIEAKSNKNQIYFTIFSKSSIKSIFK